MLDINILLFLHPIMTPKTPKYSPKVVNFYEEKSKEREH